MVSVEPGRVSVEVELAEPLERNGFNAGTRLGPLEVLATSGDPWRVERITVSMPRGWTVDCPRNDFRRAEVVLALVRAEFDKRGWGVDGLNLIVGRRR